MPEQLPSVGRIVHYVSHGTPPREDGSQEYPSVCRAAIVTEVRPVTDTDRAQADIEQWAYIPGVVGLAVLNPTGMFFNRDVMQDEDNHRGGTWHWPERA